MAGIEVKSFDKADEVNDNFNNAKIEAVKVGNQRLMKLTLQPGCLLYTSPSPRDRTRSRMPSSA